MLGHFNLEYQTASHGKEAVEIMRKSRNMTGNPDAPNFSLILLDMQMPIMDGAEAIETLRKNGLTLPIIALTANALDHHRNEALSAGATEFATMPILRDVLYEKCRHYLENSSCVDPATTSSGGVYT
jgi:CheY-like chemotaxis protein